MPAFNVLMIIIIVLSLLLCVFTLQRIIVYNRKFHLPESKYTRLFHIFTKEHIAGVYIAAILLHSMFAIWFMATL